MAELFAADDPWMVTFDVMGVPAPQGSMRAFVRGGRAVVTADNTATAPWRQVVAWRAMEAWREAGLPTLLDAPVSVHATFWLPRPRSAPKRRVWPAVKPDLDKLLRALLDAVAVDAGLLADDSRVVGLTAVKRYVSGDMQPGCHVVIRPV